MTTRRWSSKSDPRNCPESACTRTRQRKVKRRFREMCASVCETERSTTPIHDHLQAPTLFFSPLLGSRLLARTSGVSELRNPLFSHSTCTDAVHVVLLFLFHTLLCRTSYFLHSTHTQLLCTHVLKGSEWHKFLSPSGVSVINAKITLPLTFLLPRPAALP